MSWNWQEILVVLAAGFALSGYHGVAGQVVKDGALEALNAAWEKTESYDTFQMVRDELDFAMTLGGNQSAAGADEELKSSSLATIYWRKNEDSGEWDMYAVVEFNDGEDDAAAAEVVVVYGDYYLLVGDEWLSQNDLEQLGVQQFNLSDLIFRFDLSQVSENLDSSNIQTVEEGPAVEVNGKNANCFILTPTEEYAAGFADVEGGTITLSITACTDDEDRLVKIAISQTQSLTFEDEDDPNFPNGASVTSVVESIFSAFGERVQFPAGFDTGIPPGLETPPDGEVRDEEPAEVRDEEPAEVVDDVPRDADEVETATAEIDITVPGSDAMNHAVPSALLAAVAIFVFFL